MGNDKKAGEKPRKETKLKKFSKHEDALAWAMRAGVTLRCTKGHVAAHFNVNKAIRTIGINVTDALNTLREHPIPHGNATTQTTWNRK